MIRRTLVVFALFTLILISAATAHEHVMSRATAGPSEVTTRVLVALPTARAAVEHAVAWLTAPASRCADGSDTNHTHGRFADCSCPAACAGLFSVTAAMHALSAGDSGYLPPLVRRLFSTFWAPPTPPPRA